MAQLQSQTQIADSADSSLSLQERRQCDRPALLLLIADAAERIAFEQQAAVALATHTLFEAATPSQALALWRTEQVDWAILDLAWTEGGGSAFLTALGEICPQRPLPVVVLVAPGQERTALEAMKLGAADYLFKADLTPEALRTRLAQSQQASETQRQRSTALDMARQHYQNLVENSPDIIERFDLNLRHLYVSPALAAITGVSTAAFLGKTCREVGLDSTMVNNWEVAAAQVLATGEKQAIEFTTPTLIGVRHFEMAIAPEWSERGEVESLLCISRDVSDRVAVQQTQQRLLTEAQMAQRDATAARDSLAHVFDRINDGIIAFDRDSRCVYLNPSAEQTLGRTALDIIGKHIWTEFPEAVDTPVYEVYHRAIERQQPEFLEYYFPPLNGWLEVRLYPDRDGITIYFTDISDRKTAAAQHQQTEQLRHELTLLEQIVDSGLAGYWDFDFQHQTAYYSRGLKAMFGYAEDELPNRLDTWQQIVFADDIPKALASLDRHVQSRGEVQHYVEVRYRHKTGATVWVLCAGQVIEWDKAGQPLRMVGCHVDITPLKQAEAQLRKKQAHLQAAQRIGNLGSWEFELATEQIIWSDQVYRIFGLEVGANLASFEALQGYFHPEDRDRHRQTVETTIATHQPYDEEFCIVRVDGSLGHIHVKGEAVVDGANQLTHLTGTVQDISDRKRVEAERKRVEAEHRAHEEQVQGLSLRLSLALESGCIGTWSWDLHQTLSWDQRMYEIWGLESLGRAAIFDDWAARVHPDDWPTVEAAIQRALQADEPLDIEFRFYRPSGELRWIRAAAIVQRSPAGAAVAMVGINYDITEHKRAAAQTQSLSLRLSLALESARIGTWERDIETDEVSWDQCLIDLYGFAKLGRQANYFDWRKQVYAEDIQRVETAHQALVDHDIPYDLEFRVWRSDGNLGWIRSSASVRRNAQRQPLSIVGVNYDITDQKQAEAQLRDLSLRLDMALESGKIGTWEMDLVTLQINWDQRMYAIYGLPDDGLGMTFEAYRDRVYSEDLERIQVTFGRALEDIAPSTLEFRIRRGDGELRWVRGTALVQCDDQGQPRRMIGTNADITEAKRAEEQLLRTTAQLEASNRELEAFAYSVSHDLRAPLRAIDGFSRALIEDYGDQFGDEGRDYFDRIRHNVGRMGRLIDDLLRLSRVSRSAITYASVNLSTMVQEQIDELRHGEPDRAVAVAIATDLPVTADPTLMRVAIANLVQNAWKFTAHHPSARIEFGTVIQAGEKIYYLRDDGAGFDMAYANKLFGVFQRLHNTDEFPGTGIGLATVQRAIHRQGGRVWAEAAVEQGATFYFTLPSDSPGPGGWPERSP